MCLYVIYVNQTSEGGRGWDQDLLPRMMRRVSKGIHTIYATLGSRRVQLGLGIVIPDYSLIILITNIGTVGPCRALRCRAASSLGNTSISITVDLNLYHALVMIHYATIGALFIAIIVQIFPLRIPGVLGHLPTWTIYTFYALLLLRWPVGPWVLNKLSKGAAMVDSVSLRSIKGIRFSLRGVFKVECDRLGYSIRLFGRKANRRIGITFDGLRLELLHVPSNKSNPHIRNPSVAPEPSPLPHEAHELLANKAAPMLEWLKVIFPEQWVQELDEAMRAWVRYFFSLYVDFLLQVGPSIISSLSLRFSDVHVTFVELNRVNFTLSKASLGVAVNLEVVKELQMTEEQRKELKIVQRLKAKSWTDRLSGSVSRTFQAAWKGRQGTASVTLKLEEFTLFNPNPAPTQRARAQSTVSTDSGWVQFTDIEMDAPENAVVHVPGETEFSVVCDFDPRKGRIANHSARVRAGISDVTVFVDVLQGLLKDVQAMMPTSPTSPTSPKQRNGFPSSPMTPMTGTTSPPGSPPLSPPTSPRMVSIETPFVVLMLSNSQSATRFFSPPRARMPPKPKKDRNIMVCENPLYSLQFTERKRSIILTAWELIFLALRCNIPRQRVVNLFNTEVKLLV